MEQLQNVSKTKFHYCQSSTMNIQLKRKITMLFQIKEVICTIYRNFKTDGEGTKIYLELDVPKETQVSKNSLIIQNIAFIIEILIKFWWNIRNPSVEYQGSTEIVEKHCIWSKKGRNMIILEHGFVISYFVSNLYNFLLQFEAVPC